MAKIVFTKAKKEIEVPDGSPITPACEKAGVVFGCHVGVCGTCTITVTGGLENLSPRTDREVDLLGDDKGLRLACQCRILKGTVTIDF
jgi:ferredoxin